MVGAVGEEEEEEVKAAEPSDSEDQIQMCCPIIWIIHDFAYCNDCWEVKKIRGHTIGALAFTLPICKEVVLFDANASTRIVSGKPYKKMITRNQHIKLRVLVVFHMSQL